MGASFRAEWAGPAAVLIGALAMLGCDPSAGSTPPPDAAIPSQPAIPLPSLEGVEPLLEGVSLQERLRGKVGVIDLWATWCEPCRESIPKVVRLSRAYASADLVVAGIHVGAGVESAERYAADAGIAYPLYADPRFVFSDRIGSRSVPLLLVVDRDGTLVHRTRELDRETLALIRRLVEARPAL